MKPNQNLLMDLEKAVASDWSRRRLGISPEETTSAHQQICDFLKSCEYRPAASFRPAIVGALQPRRVLRSVIIREIVAREMVSRLSAEFFELTPEVREERLNALSEYVKEFPQLTWRLQLLRAGVSLVGAVPRGEDRGSQMAAAAADVFVMSPEAAARAGRKEYADQAAARKKKAVGSVASRALSGWIKLPPPGGLSQGQRQDLATARPKHLRPIGDYGKVGFLLLVIFAAFVRIALMPRPHAGGSYSRPSYTYPAPPTMPTYQQNPAGVRPLSPETMAMFLGKDEFEAYLKAQKRAEEAKKTLEELREKRQQAQQAKKSKGGMVQAFADKWQETYDNLQASDMDLQEYLEQQKERNERVLNGNPFRTIRESPEESGSDSLILRSPSPFAEDPAQQVDDFLDKLNRVRPDEAQP